MKELSIEKKAKAYDEVREKIAIRFGSNVAEEIFSEYEESEDERIRKEIIEQINLLKSATLSDLKDKQFNSWLAWLEKQGEQKPIEWSEEDERIISKILNALEFQNYYDGATGNKVIPHKEEINWINNKLKSLKLQNKWKKSLKTADLENNLWWIQGSFSDTSREYRILGEAIEYIRCTEPSWKPSEEQINALAKNVEYVNIGCTQHILKELLEDLKKLKS